MCLVRVFVAFPETPDGSVALAVFIVGNRRIVVRIFGAAVGAGLAMSTAEGPAHAFTASSFMEVIDIASVGTGFVSVSFENTYVDPVVACTYTLASSANPPAAVRLNGVSATGMQVRIQQLQNTGSVTPGPVSCIVVEEGLHTLPDGTPVEARKTVASRTHGRNAPAQWRINQMVDMSASFAGTFAAPIVLGQVMSYNDTRGQVFHANDCDSTGNPPFNSGQSDGICVAKHIGEQNGNRGNETLGIIVTSSGSASFAGYDMAAGRTGSAVSGVGNNPPYTVSTGGSFETGVITQAGENGGQGSWAVFYGAAPFTASGVSAAVDEEIAAGDTTRSHLPEQVDYWVFKPKALLDLVKDFTFLTDVNGDGHASVGDVIRYTYTAANIGKKTISNIQVTDTHNGTGTFPANPGNATLTDVAPTGNSPDTNGDATIWGTLAPGDTVTFFEDYTVTQTDVDTLQ